jgi:probable biosynthetic protein (TIGR04098 family)
MELLPASHSMHMTTVQTQTAEDFELELGMPHLGRNGLNESAFLKTIGHDRWQLLERVGGVRTHEIRDDFDNRLYATFCFVEMTLSLERPLSAYGENHRLRFARDLSHYARVYLDGRYRLLSDKLFELRCTNVFIYQLAGPQQLKMAQPENCDFSQIPELSCQPDSLDLCRSSKATGAFEGPDANNGRLGSAEVRYRLDPDRDSNGANLIYFANFVCFLDHAERALLSRHDAPADVMDARSTYWRRLGYFGNALATDELDITIRGGFEVRDNFVILAFDYRVNRVSDKKLILISSARKSLVLTDAARSWAKRLDDTFSKEADG